MELKGTTAGRSPEAYSRQTFGKPWDPQLLAAREARIALYAVRAYRRRDLWTGAPVPLGRVPDPPSNAERLRRIARNAARRRTRQEARQATRDAPDVVW